MRVDEQKGQDVERTSAGSFAPLKKFFLESILKTTMMSFRREEVAEAPVRILSPASKQYMATKLDSRKILLVNEGIHRDWRGLAEQAGLDVNSICSGKISPTEHCLHLWGQKGGLIGQLWTYLEAMDRFDVIDDTLQMIYADYDKCMTQSGGALMAVPPPFDQRVPQVAEQDSQILTVDDLNNLSKGLGLQHYDALVLFADEDIDFVQEMLEKLEGEYNLKLCHKNRDLIGGLQFESESIVKLIMERCTRVIVVLSPEFLESSTNTFFTLFAHALSVDQRRRIVIPCLYKPCVKPAVISFCHSLDYYRAKGYWNYWEKLRDSLIWQPQNTPSTPNVESRQRIREVSGSSIFSHKCQPVLLLHLHHHSLQDFSQNCCVNQMEREGTRQEHNLLRILAK
ncbi:myeloid differentiation factor 88 [Penaeus vannamei]|uniref:Myeloid differentiation factor 88 n=1 Tax=Penaeus vannamei TaxID=6689 RepID=A0A423T134_PENVA|nr:myeloid differentiation factor 88 [Penaeus vannamei]